MRCRGCGQPLDEATDIEHEHEWQAEAVRCFPCAEKSRESRDRARGSDSPDDGVLWMVTRKAVDDG